MTSATIHAFVEWDGLEGVRQLMLGVVSSSMIIELLAFFEGYATECAEVLGYLFGSFWSCLGVRQFFFVRTPFMPLQFYLRRV
jgi:hypothetical protein